MMSVKLVWRVRALVAVAVSALAGQLLIAAPAMAADAAPATPPLPAPVSAAALPTWQINGVAWSQVVVGNTVYVTGSFTKARPPGVPVGGAGEVDALNIFAYDIRTGNPVTSFNHSLNAQGLVLRAAPDGSRIYVGGDFTAVDGVARGHVAAFAVADGSLVSNWAPNVGGQVRALATSGDTVYVGGNYPSANGETRGSLASFSASTGAMSSWAPTATGTGGYVWAMTMSPDASRVIVGGSFSFLNGVDAYGMGSLDAQTGAVLPWAANQRIRTAGLNGGITSLKTDGTQIFGSGYAFGAGASFEGTFAANPSTGEINWVNDCLGDTYDTFPMDQVLYAVSHSHNCTAINEFPDTSPRSRWQKATAAPTFPTGMITVKDAYGWDYRGLPSAGLLQWYPDLEFGSYTPDRQAAWSVTGANGYVALAGEFPMVNGVAQQGLVRFAYRGVAGPSQKPIYSAAMTPSATSTESGTVRVTWQSTWDRDDKTLTYDVYRDNGASIATLTQSSVFWNLPRMGFLDTGRTPGATHTYKVRVKDSDGNVQWTVASAPVTVSSATPAAYTQSVRADGAIHLWRLGDSAAPAVDSVAFADLNASATGVAFGSAGVLADDLAVTSAGGSTTKLATPAPEPHPQAATIEAWVNTTSTSGGRIIGFGDAGMSSTSLAASNSSVLYLSNAGRVNFAVLGGTAYRGIQSARAVNDGQWHHLAATVDASGLALYVDGKLVGRDANPIALPTYAGYWRLFADQTTSLPNKPTSAGLAGAVDEVAVYPSVLTADQLRARYLLTGRTATWPTTLPADSYGAAVAAAKPDLYWRLDEASGTTALDASTTGQDGSILGGVTPGGLSAIGTGTSMSFNGSNGLVASKEQRTNPTTYSTELWFKTSTTRGGKLVGFGNAASGTSSSYDRHVCLLNNGKLQFGAYDGAQQKVETSSAYNDGQWHYLVATQGADGMKLYVDSTLVGTNPAVGAQNYAGYWRIGGDKCWGGATSTYLNGSIDEVAVYPSVLTQATIDAHYAAAGRIVPNRIPVASFTTAASYLGVTVDASASSDSDGTIASYSWQFGDGSTGSGVTAAHTYAASGTYSVILTVTDNVGATATTTRSVTVAANQAPTASFTSTVSALTATVDGSASSDAEGPIASYAWDFGDGTTGTGPTATHPYAAEGSYVVTLVVTDAVGATATTSSTITVSRPANILPTASFTLAADHLSVAVDGRASSDADGTIVGYAWSFGDGSTATGATASHTYAADGTYQVSLVVTDDRGGSATAQRAVTVVSNHAPAAVMTTTATWLMVSVDGSASADTDGQIASYAWQFGDGATATGPTATHSYAAAGTYQVSLTVTDDGGAASTVTRSVTVAPNPAYATDSFARMVSNTWGAADLGGAWTVTGTASKYSVANGVGRMTLGAGASGTATLPVSSTDTEVALVVRTDKAPSGGGQYVSVIGRSVGTSDYRAKMRVTGTGAVTLWVTRMDNSVETILGTYNVPGVVAPGEPLAIRVAVTGTSPTTVQAKVWQVGQTEPAAWQASATDSSTNLQTPGGIGIYSYVSGSATLVPVVFSYDELWIGPVRP